MLVKVNGQPREIAPDTTVATLLEQLGTTPKRVAVEVNRELVTRSRFDDAELKEGDNIEIVTFVGGG